MRKIKALFLVLGVILLMAQFARPDSDVSVGLWSPYPADPTTLFDKIDEVIPNDGTDYIGSSNDEDECEVGLSDVTDPAVGTGHTIRCYAQCPLGSGAKEQMWIALVENGNIRGQSPVHDVNRNSYALIEYTLSEVEANAITNYANLRLRFHITKVNGGEPIQITQAELEVPDASADTELVVPDVYHVLDADPIALIEHKTLAVPDVYHILDADPIALTQVHTLAVPDVFHVHAADPIVLVEHKTLVVPDVYHTLDADPIVLSTSYLLIVPDVFHTLAADPIVLTQVHSLVIPDVFHVQSVDPIVLVQVHILTVPDAFHAQAADPIALIEHKTLAVPDVFHALASDPIVLSQLHSLVVPDAFHVLDTDPIALTQAHVLAAIEAFHALAADSILLFQIHQLAVGDTTHIHLADNIVLLTGGVILVVQDTLHEHTVDGITLTQICSLLVDAGLHSLVSDNIDIVLVLDTVRPGKIAASGLSRSATEALSWSAPGSFKRSATDD